MTVHREEIDPEVCHIGRIEAFDRKTFRLYCINPDAAFDEDRETFAYSDVTRIDVDDGYENALALVAAMPNASRKGRSRPDKQGRTARRKKQWLG